MAAEELADQFEDLQLHIELPGTRLYRSDHCVGTGLLTVNEQSSKKLASATGLEGKGEKEACYNLFSHARTFPEFCDVHWTSGGNEESVCLAYTEICLHAVSRDTASFPHPCLYLLTSCVPPGGDEGGEEEGETVEMRLVLENEEKLQELFEVISEGQALHPDPEDLSSEEEGEGAEVLEDIQPLEEGAEFFRTEEDLQFLSAEGQRTLEHIEGVIVSSAETVQNGGDVNGQFEDAKEN